MRYINDHFQLDQYCATQIDAKCTIISFYAAFGVDAVYSSCLLVNDIRWNQHGLYTGPVGEFMAPMWLHVARWLGKDHRRTFVQFCLCLHPVEFNYFVTSIAPMFIAQGINRWSTIQICREVNGKVFDALIPCSGPALIHCRLKARRTGKERLTQVSQGFTLK